MRIITNTTPGGIELKIGNKVYYIHLEEEEEDGHR